MRLGLDPHGRTSVHEPDEARKALRATAMKLGSFVQEIETKQDMKIDQWMKDTLTKEMAKASKDEARSRRRKVHRPSKHAKVKLKT